MTVTDTVTDTVPLSRTLNLPLAASQRVRGLSLIHDGNNWAGSFLVAARRMIEDLLTDGPWIITVYADDNITANAAPDAVMRVTGTVVRIDEKVITFQGGETVEVERLISVHI